MHAHAGGGNPGAPPGPLVAETQKDIIWIMKKKKMKKLDTHVNPADFELNISLLGGAASHKCISVYYFFLVLLHFGPH